MEAFNEMVVYAGRHPGFFAGIIAVITSLVVSRTRMAIIKGILELPSFFVRKTYLHRSLGDALIAHLVRDGWKTKKFVGELYGEDPAFVKSEKEVKHILYRDFSSNKQLFYGKGWPVLVSGSPLVYDKDKARHFEYVVYSLRWTSNILKLLEAAADTKNVKRIDDAETSGFCIKRASGNRFFKEAQKAATSDSGERVDRSLEQVLKDPFSSLIPTRYPKSDIGQTQIHDTLEMMSLNPELEDVIEEVKFWFNNRDWYEERGIPWKRGMLFYGDPGTGKTLLSRALAEHLDVPLIIFDLPSMTNQDLIHCYSQILPGRIVLFEDIDGVFNKRESIANPDLTFDCLLNVLDGADKKEGILNIITTNHPDKLDYALGGPDEGENYVPGTILKMPQRPGRIDRSVLFLPLDRAGRLKVAMRIVKDEALAAKLVDEGINDSAAQLQERCFRAATQALWNSRKEKKDGNNASNGHNHKPVDVPPAP